MNPGYRYKNIPRSRIATFDTFSVGMQRHHVIALLEFDITESRKKLKEMRRQGMSVSLTAWLIKVIGMVLKENPEGASYLIGKRKLMIFDSINISILVEKVVRGERVPIPLVIEKADAKSAAVISAEIEKAKSQSISSDDIVMNRHISCAERLYYVLPGFARRFAWKVMLSSPGFAFRKMGNAAVTSVGMIGKINGWFIHRSVHPVSFGIGSVIKKPVVVDSEVKIREILNMTVLIDHDLVDGAPMVRMLNDLTNYIEKGAFIDNLAV